jgi:hypothetical protein
VHGVFNADTETDIGERMVRVRYDSIKLSIKNIEFAIAEAGFRANEVPADAKAAAALPAECSAAAPAGP